MSARRRPGGAGGTVRVVAGAHRGRRLEVPPGAGTRPTSDRVRQAVFNALESLGAVEDAVVLDGFAGSGALGIEALSRGASHVTFVEADPAARAVVARNVAALGLGTRATVVGRPLREALVGRSGIDLVLLDPPYAHEGWDDLLSAVTGALADDAVVVVESDREVALPDGLRGIRIKTYGGTVVQFAIPSGAPS